MKKCAVVPSYSSAQLSGRSQICTPLLALRIRCEQECPDLHGLQLYNKVLTATQLPPHSRPLLVVNMQALLIFRFPAYPLASPPPQAIHLRRCPTFDACMGLYSPTEASAACATVPHVLQVLPQIALAIDATRARGLCALIGTSHVS